MYRGLFGLFVVHKSRIWAILVSIIAIIINQCAHVSCIHIPFFWLACFSGWSLVSSNSSAHKTVCMFVFIICICVYVYVCRHTYLHTYIHTYLHTWVCVYTFVCISVYGCLYVVFLCASLYVRINIYFCVCEKLRRYLDYRWCKHVAAGGPL